MRSQKLAIITILAASMLTMSALSTITPYNVFAKSNTQSTAAANDCPAWLDADNFISAVQEQSHTNCLIDTDIVQDSDGTATASGPSNTGPSQDQKIKLNIDVDIDRTTPPTTPPPEPQTGIVNVFKIVECTDSANENIPEMCDPSWYPMFIAFGINPNPSSFQGSSTGTPVSLEPGQYSVGEQVPLLVGAVWDYDESLGCDGFIEAGQEITCTFTNYVDYVEE